MISNQFILPLAREINVDLFAGGGGWSSAFETATGQHVDIAINHDADAISMHEVNHPQAKHYKADVFEVDPREAVGGMPVGWLHLSPDCTHHSQAKGGQPRSRKLRALAWVGVRWAGQVRPRIISLENVKQILSWGPLIAKRDKATGRVLRLDGTIADKGERVPLEQQFLVPDPARAGQTWKSFVSVLRGMGYEVEWKRLVAADFGAPTTRDRLFMLARCDGQPIVWPKPTHLKSPTKKQKKWRAAAECIDWLISGKSVFDREKPLAEATMCRIARGTKRYVLDSADPFIVPIANWSNDAVHSIRDPLSTVTASPKGGQHAVVTPVLIQAGHGGGQAIAAASLVKFRHDSDGADVNNPLPTITSGAGAARPAGNAHAMGVMTAFLAQMNGGPRESTGHDLRNPASTITKSGSQQQLVEAKLVSPLIVGVGGRAGQTEPRPCDEPHYTVTSKGDAAIVTAHLAHLRGNCDARNVNGPLMTVSAGGQHHGLVTAHMLAMGENAIGHDLRDPAQTVMAGAPRYGLVECELSPDDEAGALRVAAFFIRYYGEGGQWGDLRDPMHTLTTKDRLALVTVYIKGTPYVIVDIKLRMLEPHELYAAQGFPANYIITHGHDGRKLSKSARVKMCGNSVSPPPASALIRVNWTTQESMRKAA